MSAPDFSQAADLNKLSANWAMPICQGGNKSRVFAIFDVA